MASGEVQMEVKQQEGQAPLDRKPPPSNHDHNPVQEKDNGVMDTHSQPKRTNPSEDHHANNNSHDHPHLQQRQQQNEQDDSTMILPGSPQVSRQKSQQSNFNCRRGGKMQWCYSPDSPLMAHLLGAITHYGGHCVRWWWRLGSPLCNSRLTMEESIWKSWDNGERPPSKPFLLEFPSPSDWHQ